MFAQTTSMHPAGRMPVLALYLLVGFVVLGTGCAGPGSRKPGALLKRSGDEIIVAGQLFHTGTRVITWMDPGGYDAYRVERRFVAITESSWERSVTALPAKASPNRYGLRQERLTPEQAETVRGGGWPLDLLQQTVDQFVIHFDASGTSRRCFETLHDKRCLSVHFMIDLDGTIYQTLDLKERAWHATTSNGRSVGVELASPGAFPPTATKGARDWYQRRQDGYMRIAVPGGNDRAGFKVPGYDPSPARPELIQGVIQGQTLQQYDFTEAQYRALEKLTATLCRVFPKLRCDYPRGLDGHLVREKLPDEVLKDYSGLIGHYHIQTDKVDPGPAMDWDRVINGARKLSR
ncbi:MAG: N-acetylmuramoyl-L-alanine amidase [Verrucomicrobia bacterium]|nr:N-acetylmuramoyl-L-alanine amidase [Verrucomicrobiota bacterium]